MTGVVIVAATSKGGAGKSTVIACLAVLWRDRGKRVSLVDADPNRTLSRWHGKGDVLGALPLFAEADENELLGCIRGASEASDVALVDCPGVSSQIMVYAIGAADFVLIPTMADEAGIYEAMRTIRTVENAGQIARRDIPYNTFLSRVKRSHVVAHAHEQLVALEARPLETQFGDRAVFQEATFYGSTPGHLAPNSKADLEIRALGDELEQLNWWPRLSRASSTCCYPVAVAKGA